MYVPMLFSLILSGRMLLLVPGIAAGLIAGVFGMWASAWLTAWAVAFPAVMVVAPFTQRIVGRLVAED